MKQPISKPLTYLTAILTAIAFSSPVYSAKNNNGKGTDASSKLSLVTSLASENGTIANTAEPGELLVYGIAITNSRNKHFLTFV